MPHEKDWDTIIRYGESIRKTTYDESANNVASAIFPVLDEHRPMLYILPRLQELTWKVETPAALERCTMFLNPTLEVINLEVSTRFQKVNDFLADMSSRVKLKGFSFISPTSLPDAFTELLLGQDALEKVVLVAPGALAPGIGRWVASLPELKHLQLDLTGRSPIAVEGFFDELLPRSGDSTPSSIASRDSGIFSGEEVDFTEIRKSMLRLTGDLRRKGSFTKLKRVHLTGEVANIAVFLKHLESNLSHLELVIEDPPDSADWQDLSELICDRFSDSLQSIRITATPSAKFADLVRSTPRAEPPTARLSLLKLAGLKRLVRFDVDLPESVVFTPADIEALANACPKLEIVKLCPLARFPLPHSPKITLESLVPLISGCRHLHTLAAVFIASGGSEKVLKSQHASSKSLLRLHAGHSWANDPLHISIFLSHLAPRLELLKWFQEKNRPGFIEAHSKAWQSVSEILPHVQQVRETEKSFIDIVIPEPEKPETSEKSVDATRPTKSMGVDACVETRSEGIQFSPVLVNREVEAVVKTVETSIDATPPTQDVSIEAQPLSVTTAVMAALRTGKGNPFYQHSFVRQSQPPFYFFSSILSLLTFFYRCGVFPFAFTSHVFHLVLSRVNDLNWRAGGSVDLPKPSSPAAVSSDSIQLENSISLDTLPVRL